jgi:hypothetical protein
LQKERRGLGFFFFYFEEVFNKIADYTMYEVDLHDTMAEYDGILGLQLKNINPLNYLL